MAIVEAISTRIGRIYGPSWGFIPNSPAEYGVLVALVALLIVSSVSAFQLTRRLL
jgi:hypothetical protein